MAAALEFLEAQGATRPELAEWYAALADLYQRKLWHQLTLKLDQFLGLAVVQVRHLIDSADDDLSFCCPHGCYAA